MNTRTKPARAVAQGEQRFDRAVAGLKTDMQTALQAADAEEFAINNSIKGVGNVMRTAEEIVSFNQGNVEAAFQSGQNLVTGIQDLSKQAAATTQARMEESMSALRALANVKSVRDAFELQSNLGRANVEKVFADTSRLVEASFKMWEQVMAPINQRITIATEKFTTAA